MFDFAIREFGDKIKHVEGIWNGNGAYADNYKSFIKHFAEKGDDAVWDTFTGKQAKKHGFTEIVGKVDHNEESKTVEVVFGKPKK